MKKAWLAGLLGIIAMTLSACGVPIQANETAVFNYNPYFFGSAYLDDRPYHGPNRFFYILGTSMKVCNNSPVPVVVHADDFMSSDRVMLDFDVAILVGIKNRDKCAQLYRTHGTTDHIEVFRRLVAKEVDIGGVKTTTGEFLSYLREQVKHLHSNEFIASQDEHGKPSDRAAKIEKDAKIYLETFLKENGAEMVGVLNIALGRANPPDHVKKAMSDTAAAAQEVKTQYELKRKETARAETETEKAKADKAYMNGLSLSPELYVQLKQIEACRDSKVQCIFSSVPVMVKGR